MGFYPKIGYRGTPEERFWKYVVKGKKENDCWEWVGSKMTQGYGMLSVNKKFIGAHRFSYMLHKGGIAKKMLVCHSCDNPPCVNPKHLWLGTDKENTQDMIKKRRYIAPSGEHSSMAKFTQIEISKIRQRYKTGKYKKIELAKMFNVTKLTMLNILNNKTYKV